MRGTDLAQDRYKCRGIMNTVITPRTPYVRGRGGEELITSQAAVAAQELVREISCSSTGRSTSECHRVSSGLLGSPPSPFPNTGSSKYDGTQLTLHSRVNRRPVTAGTVVWIYLSDTRGQERASDAASNIIIADLKT